MYSISEIYDWKDDYFKATGIIRCKHIKYYNSLISVRYGAEFIFIRNIESQLAYEFSSRVMWDSRDNVGTDNCPYDFIPKKL